MCSPELSRKLEFSVRFSREDARERPFFYLPFEVSAGTDLIEVEYDHSEGPEDDPNVIDIGIFGPGNFELFQADRFRGWSGSARKSFFVSEYESTPGYIAGKIDEGTWRIILGLYKISEKGCECRVRVSTKNLEVRSRAPLPAKTYAAPRPVKKGWYKGDLHVHSTHSDGEQSVPELADEATKRGLDFIAITDHNTVSQLSDIRKHLEGRTLLLPGEEITTYHGHANVWGNDTWIEFRLENEQHFSRLIREVHREGLIISVCHPKEFGPNWEFKRLRGFDAVEVWQGLWPTLNFQSVSWWEELLKEGNRIVAVGGSDIHRLENEPGRSVYDIGTPTTWVFCSGLSKELLLSAIRAGRVFISRDPVGPGISFEARNPKTNETAMMGDEIAFSKGDELQLHLRVKRGRGGLARLLSERGEIKRVLVDSDEFEECWKARPEGNGYLRVEILDPDYGLGTDEREVAALSNPIYLRIL
jgi:hypothetical protein